MENLGVDGGVGVHGCIDYGFKKMEDIRPFVGPFWLPGLLMCLLWVSKPEWMPHLHTSSPVCKGFLRFTSGGTPVDFLAASISGGSMIFLRGVRQLPKWMC